MIVAGPFVRYLLGADSLPSYGACMFTFARWDALAVGTLYGAYAGTCVASDTDLRGHGRHQKLPVDEFAKVCLEERYPAGVPDEQADLDVVHGEHHGARSAGLAKDVAHFGQLGERGATAAKFLRNAGGEELGFAGRVKGLGREAGVAVDVGGMPGGNLGRVRVNRVRRSWTVTLSAASIGIRSLEGVADQSTRRKYQSML